MKQLLIKKSVIYYDKLLKKKFGQPKGCTQEEVTGLEEEIGYELPRAYVEFLLWMGKDYNGLFRGSDWFFKDVHENTLYLPEFLSENKLDINLSEKYLAFFCHQGYMIAWFVLPKEGDDPPVFYYSEGAKSKQPKNIKSFSSFLLAEIKMFSG